ncbi:hypothetical protein CTEN210_18463 [Chaetoceros tenuissimus]|uniref:RNA-dependent RNA polymerase n=1 Tax=Chaetoceros tenuissimus TaxID=426638 RepID=A0AAD3DDJ9_9STRA|nr:hypothetical protein CTEN210_18463 [Chaetoceros tenuissimus]
MSDPSKPQTYIKKNVDDDKTRGRIPEEPNLLSSQHVSFQESSSSLFLSSSSNESSSSDESDVSLYTPANDRLENILKKSTSRKNKATSSVNLRRNHSIHSRNARSLVGWQLCKNGRFKARVFYNGKVIQFGSFLLKADAAEMYDRVRAIIEEGSCDDLEATAQIQVASMKTRYMSRNFYTEQEYIVSRTGELVEMARLSAETLGELLIESKPAFLTKEEILYRLRGLHRRNRVKEEIEGGNNKAVPSVISSNHTDGDNTAVSATFCPESPSQSVGVPSTDTAATPNKSIEYIARRPPFEVVTASPPSTRNAFAKESPTNDESKNINNFSEMANLDNAFYPHPSTKFHNISESSEIDYNEGALDSFQEGDKKLPADDGSQVEKAVIHQVASNVGPSSASKSEDHDQEARLPDEHTAHDSSGVEEAVFQQVSFNDGPSSASKSDQDQDLLSLEGIQEQRLCDVIMACDTPRASRSRSKGVPYSENLLSRNNIDYSFWQSIKARENVKSTTSSSHQKHCCDDDIDSDDSLRDAYNILMGGYDGESYSSESDLSDSSLSDDSSLDQDDYSIVVSEANESHPRNRSTNKRTYVPSSSNFKAKKVFRKRNKNDSSRRRKKQKRKHLTKRKRSNPTKRRNTVSSREIQSPFFRQPSFRVGSQQGGHSCYPLNPRDKSHSMWVHILDSSLLYFERKGNEELSKIHRDQSGQYILVSRKEVDSKGSYLFGPRNKFEYMYAQENVTSESSDSSISIVELLESLGDFAKLTTRKVVSRLELFQSPAHQVGVDAQGEKKFLIREFDSSLVEEIEDDGHEGCGYISEKFLSSLFTRESAQNIISLQVRLFIPTRGIFKGMLMKQRNAKASICLPTSMKKVDKSKKPRNKNACIVVCKAGVDPSKNAKQIAKLPHVDKDASGPAKSFEVKKLSKMLIRLLVAIGVPRKVVDRYVNRSAFRSHEQEKKGKFHLHHAFVRGVADPTSNRSMEPNTIFISGISNSLKPFPDAILITRSPCIKATDIHLVKLVKSKPEKMSSEDYKWLCELPFGAVIFGFPRKGCHTMPSAIAKGDLDGDRYFIIWDEEILKHSQAPLLVDKILPSDEKDENTKEVIDDPDWFTKAQDFMVNPETGLVAALIGKLYKASEKAADDDEDNKMMNEDAMAFADAYYDALENAKHGTKIKLPQHLWPELPEKFWKFLEPI